MTVTALFLIVALGDPAAHLSGRVLDPQGLPITEAPVELSCKGGVLRTTTDSRGDFEFHSQSSMAGCDLSVRREGFEPFIRTIADGQVNVVIALQIARVTESVEVSPSSEMPPTDPIGSIVLTSEQLKRISDRTEDLVRQAVLTAAGSAGSSAIYVDGLPAHVLPPVEMIERLGVNLGPFSAEYGDGDVNRVEIVTRSASRRLRISPSGSLLGFGGGSSLRPGTRSESQSGGITVSGPLPTLPITLFGDVSVTNNRSELPIEAAVPTNTDWMPLDEPLSATSTSRIWSASTAAHYASASGMKVYTAYYGRRSRNSNVGVGGLVLPEAGFSDQVTSSNVQVSVRTDRGGLLQEGGLVVRIFSSGMDANSTRVGLSVDGSFVAGGAAVATQQTQRSAWVAKYVARSNSTRLWTAGLVISATSQRDVSVPNSSGSLEFENMNGYTTGLEGGATAIWRVARSWGRVEYKNTTLAPFLQKTLVQTHRVEIDGGVRADFQSKVGTVLSPRLWAASMWNGFKVQGGVGLFVYPVPDVVFITPLRISNSNVQQYVATGVGVVDPLGGPYPMSPLRAEIAHDLVSPRQWLQRGAIERRIRAFTSSLEYTWARDYHRLGSDRIADGGGWVDMMESNRAAVRHRLHARLRYEWGRQSLMGHYEWIRASDNSDGPFSYPERAGQYALEWAPSAAFAPHNLTVAGAFSLPADVSVMLTDTWQSAVPFNITTGADDDRNGLLIERGGRPRNSGRGPDQHLVSLHASRRFAVPAPTGRSRDRMSVTTGVQIDNLLDRTNVIALGSVAGAATFGRPLAALSGRSMRFWISVY